MGAKEIIILVFAAMGIIVSLGLLAAILIERADTNRRKQRIAQQIAALEWWAEYGNESD